MAEYYKHKPDPRHSPRDQMAVAMRMACGMRAHRSEHSSIVLPLPPSRRNRRTSRQERAPADAVHGCRFGSRRAFVQSLVSHLTVQCLMLSNSSTDSSLLFRRVSETPETASVSALTHCLTPAIRSWHKPQRSSRVLPPWPPRPLGQGSRSRRSALLGVVVAAGHVADAATSRICHVVSCRGERPLQRPL
ncbi:hypothetical protein ACVWXO_008273 [Bradyrhizobium sp. LM2.7]